MKWKLSDITIRIGFYLILYGSNVIFARDIFSVLITMPAALICFFAVFRIKEKYVQVADMFWLCCFLFFVISPIQRINNFQLAAPGERPLFQYGASDFIIASAIVILSLVPMCFTKMSLRANDSINNKGPGLILLLFVSVASFIIYIFGNGGLQKVLSPRLGFREADLFLAGPLFVGMLSVSVVCMMIIFKRKAKFYSAVSLTLGMVMLFITKNPFNAARFELVGVWLPVLLAYVGGRLRVVTFYVGSLLGMLVLFPILNLTTRFGLDSIGRIGEISFQKTYFNLPFIDVFDTLVHCARFMRDSSLFFGEKTVAILLFFVPRAWWPDKPIVGGLDVGYDLYWANQQGGTFNLSFFIGGDFYMDFGLIGVLIGFCGIALILEWCCRASVGRVFNYPVLGSILLASLPIILRGPVGAILALFVCQVFAIVAFSSMSGRSGMGATPSAVSRAARRIKQLSFREPSTGPRPPSARAWTQK